MTVYMIVVVPMPLSLIGQYIDFIPTAVER